jgi:predicted metal-dependent HD superfamily phosphohydrolase
MMLQEEFFNVCKHYTDDKSIIQDLWEEIKRCYSSSGRHYHNYVHLQHLFRDLLVVKQQINDWDSLLLALLYHDIVYDPASKTNEEESAQLMAIRLSSIRVPSEKINKCEMHVLATKNHITTAQPDTSFFVDADLAILGAPWPAYYTYSRQIRKEYMMYADNIYWEGRKAVLSKFLSQDRIYKTDHFFLLYERQAKKNIKKELTAAS